MWPVLYSNVLYGTLLYLSVLYCTVMYFTVLYCTVLYFTVLYLYYDGEIKLEHEENTEGFPEGSGYISPDIPT